jgi:AAA domain/DnaB-like helicase N terminal domain
VKTPNVERLPPQALDAEQALLGCLMLTDDPALVQRTREIIHQGDFFLTAHRHTWNAICDLHDRGEPTDILTVAQALERAGRLDVAGGRPHLLACQALVPAISRAPAYAREVLTSSLQRQLNTRFNELAARAQDGGDPADLIAAAAEVGSWPGAGGERSLPEIRSAAAIMALDLPPLRWAVPELIPEGVTLFVGPPKQYKSWLAYQTAIAVATGGRALGKIPCEPGPVLYLAMEDGDARMQYRLNVLCEEGERPKELFLVNRWRPLEGGAIPDLRHYLKENPSTRLVIVDTFAALREEPDARANAYYSDSRAIQLFRPLSAQFNVSIVIVHHTNKATWDDWTKGVSGSQGLFGRADGLISLERLRGETSARLKVTGRDVAEQNLLLSWEDHSGWTLEGDARELLRTQAEERVFGAFRAAGMVQMKCAEIAAELNQSAAVTRVQLHRMRQKGLLVTRDGIWSAARAELLGLPVTQGN